MGTFDDIAVSARDPFKDAFGQSLVVLPDGVTERTITGIIEYQEVEAIPGLAHGKSRSIFITVDNDSTTGLSTDEFNSGKALVKVPEDIGKSAVTKRISKIIFQDAGIVKYQVR